MNDVLIHRRLKTPRVYETVSVNYAVEILLARWPGKLPRRQCMRSHTHAVIICGAVFQCRPHGLLSYTYRRTERLLGYNERYHLENEVANCARRPRDSSALSCSRVGN